MVLEETLHYSVGPLDKMRSNRTIGLPTSAVSGPTAPVMSLLSGEDRTGRISLKK